MGMARRRLAARLQGASLALLLVIGAAGTARAADDLGPPTSPAEQCLAPPVAERHVPAYPPKMMEIRRGATVRVRLTFDGPRSAPSVRFVDDPLDDFRSAVLDYAEQLRVPCMPPGAAPVTLSQQFEFVANDGRKVAWTPPLEEPAALSAADMPCTIDANTRMAKPDYPRDLRGKEGNVVIRLRFVDPAQPPEVTVLDNGGDKLFAHAVTSSVQALRMTCRDKVVPFSIQVFYKFLIDGSTNRMVLKDMSLAQFIGAVKPFPRGGVYFDTTQMKCPFDVRLTLRQPWSRNRIEELEEDVESRHAFISWLSTLELDIPARPANLMLGQSTVIEVPCAKVDL